MKQALINSICVGVGGMIGSLCRYGLSVLLQRQSLTIPAGTLAANLGGCLIIGALAQLMEPVPWLTPAARLLLATGFCGGFTTMSSLVYESSQLLRDGEYLHAGGYLLGTVAGCLVLFYAGALAVKMVFRTTGGIWN